MCYDLSYLSRKNYKYAERHGSKEDVEAYKSKLEKVEQQPTYYVSGFVHPKLPVITNEKPQEFQPYNWGLIPFWVKSPADAAKLSKQCLNARGESIFEKPSFREAAKQRRCLITCIDGFFEHHHIGGKSYPFYISLKNNESMTFAGLWERWEDKSTGSIRYTATIVTTEANGLMAKIHNNERAQTEGPRMPVILPPELERNWLKPFNDKADKELLQELIKPYDEDLMQAWPVKQLKGKNGIGNKEEAHSFYDYEEIAF